MSVWGKPQPSRSDFSSWWMFCRSVWILCTGVLGFACQRVVQRWVRKCRCSGLVFCTRRCSWFWLWFWRGFLLQRRRICRFRWGTRTALLFRSLGPRFGLVRRGVVVGWCRVGFGAMLGFLLGWWFGKVWNKFKFYIVGNCLPWVGDY